MSNFYLDIDGPTSMDAYLQVKHDDTDGAVLSVASILEKDDARIEAGKIVDRYNAHEELVDVLRKIAEYENSAPQLPPALHRKAQRALNRCNAGVSFILADDVPSNPVV